jgi:hypothetical protein
MRLHLWFSNLSTDREILKNCVQDVELSLGEAVNPRMFSEIVASYYGLSMTLKTWEKIDEAAKWAIENNRNSFGIVLAIIRAMRDNDVLDMGKFND